MGLFDNADLLARTKRLVKRPATDQSMDDPAWYALLTEAQLKVLEELSNHAPESQYTTEQLTTADGGASYSFASEPFGGQIELRVGRTGRLLLPGPDWDPAADYVIGAGLGQKVVFPGGVQRSYAGGLWARYVKTPGVIDSGTQPTLTPTFARRALPAYAAYLWAKQPGVAADPQQFLDLYGEAMWGNPQAAGDVGIVGTLKNQFFLAGSAAVPAEGGYWWRSIDDGSGYVVVRHD